MTIDIWSKINNHLNQFYFQFVPAIAGATNINFIDITKLSWVELSHKPKPVLPIPDWFERPVHVLFTKISNQKSIIANTFSPYKEAGDGDGMSDFDLIIDAIMVPEPIDQPMPVEPVGNTGDDD